MAVLQLFGTSQRSSVVEQLFRKQQVGSSILPVGSSACYSGRGDAPDYLSAHQSAIAGYGLPTLSGSRDRVETATFSTAPGVQGIVIPLPSVHSWNWSS